MVAIGVAAACHEYSSAPSVRELGPNPCVLGDRSTGLARLEPWLGGRAFFLPVELVSAPGSHDVYLAEMYGKIHRIDPATNDVRTVADLADRGINAGGVRGLAIHPSKPRAFVVVECPAVEDDPLDTAHALEGELRSYALSPDGTFDLATEALVLRVHIPNGSHGMNTVRFGPDGKLYVSIGDGRVSNAHVPPRYDGTALRGSILRIDVDHGEPYVVPADNPFVNVPGMRDEVFAYGFRNPWKFSFDSAHGDLWVGDVGETRTEEVNLVVGGANYGWPGLEGTDCHPNAPRCDPRGTTAPTFSYSHASGTSITGGYVYRGSRVPALAGKYIYSDFQAGGVWAVDLAVKGAIPVQLNKGEVRPISDAISEGADRELFVIDWMSGIVYTLEPDTTAPERPPIATRLSETGCFDGADLAEPSPHLVPYDVNVELWSDGAPKQRFLSLPTGTSLEAEPDGNLVLPPGGLALKTFFDGTKPIETRVLGRQGNGEWVGASYEWNAEGTDAVLLDDARELTLSSGRPWTVPGPAQCFLCHTLSAGVSLGLDARQLHPPTGAGVTTESDLERLERMGLVQGARSEEAPFERLASAAPLEVRARAYLHTNCSMCHRPGTPVLSVLDFRAETPFDKTGLCETCGPGCRFVTPGSPEESLLSIRMHARGAFPSLRYDDTQMPPIATHFLDPVGTRIIDEWIATAECEGWELPLPEVASGE